MQFKDIDVQMCHTFWISRTIFEWYIQGLKPLLPIAQIAFSIKKRNDNIPTRKNLYQWIYERSGSHIAAHKQDKQRKI